MEASVDVDGPQSWRTIMAAQSNKRIMAGEKKKEIWTSMVSEMIIDYFIQMSHATKKPVFGCLRPGKTQTILLSNRN